MISTESHDTASVKRVLLRSPGGVKKIIYLSLSNTCRVAECKIYMVPQNAIGLES